MIIKAKTAQKAIYSEIDLKDIPDGSYTGDMDGYEVCFTMNGEMYKLTTEQGIRIFCARCVVIVRDGDVRTLIK